MEEMTEALGRGLGDQDSRSFLKLQLERAGVEIAVDPDRLRQAIEATRPPAAPLKVHEATGSPSTCSRSSSSGMTGTTDLS
jgi:hypothetical protein